MAAPRPFLLVTTVPGAHHRRYASASRAVERATTLAAEHPDAEITVEVVGADGPKIRVDKQDLWQNADGEKCRVDVERATTMLATSAGSAVTVYDEPVGSDWREPYRRAFAAGDVHPPHGDPITHWRFGCNCTPCVDAYDDLIAKLADTDPSWVHGQARNQGCSCVLCIDGYRAKIRGYQQALRRRQYYEVTETVRIVKTRRVLVRAFNGGEAREEGCRLLDQGEGEESVETRRPQIVTRIAWAENSEAAVHA